MSIVATLVGFGVRQVLDLGEDLNGGRFIEAVEQHFTDHSQVLPKALLRAHERAWKALECALAGRSLLDRVQGFFASGDDKGFRKEVQLFLEKCVESTDATADEIRRRCLRELNRLRQASQSEAMELVPREIAREAGTFLRHSKPADLVRGAGKAAQRIADALGKEGYLHLPHLLRLAPEGRTPILVAAFSYFLRREIEQNQELANGMTVDGLTRLTRDQAKAFEELDNALHKAARQMEDGIAGVLADLEEIHKHVLATRQKVEQIEKTLQELLSRTHTLPGPVRPEDSLSIRSPHEKKLVVNLLESFRNLPPEDQDRLPELMRNLGKLLHGIGEYASARELAEQSARVLAETEARAEAFFNAYQAALQERNLPAALEAIKQAGSLAPARFAPLSHDRYELVDILGVGGFGTVFRYRHRYLGSEVAVKALHAEALDREPAKVFGEALVLKQIQHANIIEVIDCGYALDDTRTNHRARPWIMMRFFPGETLATLLARESSLPLPDALEIGRQIAEAVHSAHQYGVLHRDLKPENILVRKTTSWEVRVIDFGLALHQHAIETSMIVDSGGTTILSETVAGTQRYAPPEQMGFAVKGKRVPVGFYSDVYTFGRTMCQTLFGSIHPSRDDWRKVKKDLATMLEKCIAEAPEKRHSSFEPILDVIWKHAPPPPPPLSRGRRKPPANTGRKGNSEPSWDETHRERQPNSETPTIAPEVSLPIDGEQKIAQIVREAFDRARSNKLPAADRLKADAIRAGHHITKTRMEDIIRLERAAWSQRQQ